jgi:hypothetical protein
MAPPQQAQMPVKSVNLSITRGGIIFGLRAFRDFWTASNSATETMGRHFHDGVFCLGLPAFVLEVIGIGPTG